MTESLIENILMSIALIELKDDDDLITNRITVFNKVILEGFKILYELENTENE